MGIYHTYSAPNGSLRDIATIYNYLAPKSANVGSGLIERIPFLILGHALLQDCHRVLFVGATKAEHLCFH